MSATRPDLHHICRRGAPRGRTVLTAAVSVVAAVTLVAGCAGASGTGTGSSVSEKGSPHTPAGSVAPQLARTTRAPAELPGVGPKTLAEVPADARQAVLVTGSGHNAPTSEVQLFQRDPATGWTPAGPVWAAHNALHGWSANHHSDDLRTPIGVFNLTDAGGRLADPGTKLTYDHSSVGFESPGTGFEGESLADAFDYVIAINYNRKPGTSPLDWTRPLGDSRGGGIWFHVDHGGPTHGCVSLPQSAMKTLLRTLTPTQHPVVVMGDASALAS
jgi:L,D-peptidoglycan transpeptidase YkuD (ErfK/YbiS/YcfS/YnhG family)